MLSGDDHRAALALFVRIPLAAKLDVEILDHKFSLTHFGISNLYRCRNERTSFLVFIEALTSFQDATLDRHIQTVKAFVSNYNRPCRNYLFVLTGARVPGLVPCTFRKSHGGCPATFRLRHGRLGDPKLANLSDRTVPEDIIARRFLLLGALRHGSMDVLLKTLTGTHPPEARPKKSTPKPSRTP